MTQHDHPGTETAPPPAPRNLTAVAARRSWMEPRVRTWWVAALLLLLFAIGWSARQYGSWNRQMTLVREGVKLDASVWVPQDFKANNRIPNRSIQTGAAIILLWEVDGREYTGQSVAATSLISGKTIPLWVDRNDPERWTDSDNIPPLIRELVALIVLIPVVLICVLVAWIMRRQTVSLWKKGRLFQAVTVSSRLSATAPFSRQVRCALVDSHDKRLLTVSIPTRKGVPAQGEIFYILVPPTNFNRAVAVRCFG